jgi:outer membrane murein-binding lipoprotein Lpp
LGQINQKLDKLFTDVTELKIGQAEIKGNIKAVDERLSGQIKPLDTKVEQLDQRVGNQEFTGFINCGIHFRRRPLYQLRDFGRVNCSYFREWC